MNIPPIVRKIFFQVHLWTGLVLGVFFVLLGVSGSILVYDEDISAWVNPMPRATHGTALPLEKIADAAREAVVVPPRATVTVTMPYAEGDPAIVRFAAAAGGPGRAGAGRGTPSSARGTQDNAAGRGQRADAPQPIPQVFVDPVTGKVLGTRAAGLLPAFAFLHSMHGNLFISGWGRQFVGWLGVAMCFLGLSGLYLWWPKKGQWHLAFKVRKTAKGLRFHRELHGAVGIWGLIVFMIVSFTGVTISFPNTFRPLFADGSAPQPAVAAAPGRGAAVLIPSVEPVEGSKPISGMRAMQLAKLEMPDQNPRGVSFPARPDQAYSVTVAPGTGAPPAGTATTVYVDQWKGKVASMRTPANAAGSHFMALQRPIHQGTGGPIWRFLTFLSGLMPVVFVVTGLIMWWKKRQNRTSVSARAISEPSG